MSASSRRRLRLLRGGELEDGVGLVGHQFRIEALEEADSDFVGREIDVVADIGAHRAALAEVPITEVAEDGLVLVEVYRGVVNGHDAYPADGESIKCGAVWAAGEVRGHRGGGIERDEEGFHGAVHIISSVV